VSNLAEVLVLDGINGSIPGNSGLSIVVNVPTRRVHGEIFGFDIFLQALDNLYARRMFEREIGAASIHDKHLLRCRIWNRGLRQRPQEANIHVPSNPRK
jgi:hypothetical protein